MKKLLLAAAAALLMSGSASATTWAVVGSYTNPGWNFEASTVLTGEGDNLSCTIANLTNDFKIVDIDESSWAIQYGTSTPIEINKPIVLTAKNGGPDPANMTFAGLIQSVKNATVKWNPSTATMEISASESDLVIAYPTLYVTGSFCSWNAPGEGASVLCNQTDGIYTATVDLGTSGNVEFKLAGSGWSNEIAGGVTVGDETAVSVTRGGENLKTTLTGTQTLTFNYKTMLMTFGDPSLTEGEPSVPERTWAVVGAYSDPSWNFEASSTFTGEGNNLTCQIENLITGFKIVDITNNNWDIQYGTSTPVEANKTYTLDAKNGGDDPANIEFAGMLQSIKNATIKWNPSTAEMEIVAAESDLVYGNPVYYVTGSFCDWAGPGSESTILMNEKEGIYTATFDLGSAEKTEFKIAGTGWSNEIAGGVEVNNNPVAVTKGGANLFTYLTGQQTLTFNYNTMMMTFGDPTNVGVNTVEADDNTAPVYYNMQGVRVMNPEKGIYIVKKGSNVTKIVK